MSACFYNNSGSMGGLDIHEYMGLVLPNPLPVPGVSFYFVKAQFRQIPATFLKRTPTLTSDGHKMIRGGFDLYLVLHLPVFPIAPIPLMLPHPVVQVTTTAEIIRDSSSKAQLQAHSVTYRGDPLATCILGPVGLNVNCQLLGAGAPTGLVLNINSVITQPTCGDYIGAIAGYLADSLIGIALNPGTPGWVKHLWRRIGDVPFFSILDQPSRIQNFVQRLIDDGPDAAVDGLVEDAKKSITDPIDKAKDLADKYLK